jgi:hypothetical protein
VTLLAPIASVAWIPLAIFAFGIGDGAAIFVVFISVVFTLTLGTVNNMHNVEQLYINTARVLGANRRQVIQHVIFPAILPNLFVIMRINLFGAWMGVLAAEMVGVRTGMGAIVVAGRQMMNMNLTFLGMAMIGWWAASSTSFGLIRNVCGGGGAQLCCESVTTQILLPGEGVRKRQYCQKSHHLKLAGKEEQWTLENAHGRDRLYRLKVWGTDTPREVVARTP